MILWLHEIKIDSWRPAIRIASIPLGLSWSRRYKKQIHETPWNPFSPRNSFDIWSCCGSSLSSFYIDFSPTRSPTFLEFLGFHQSWASASETQQQEISAAEENLQSFCGYLLSPLAMCSALKENAYSSNRRCYDGIGQNLSERHYFTLLPGNPSIASPLGVMEASVTCNKSLLKPKWRGSVSHRFMFVSNISNARLQSCHCIPSTNLKSAWKGTCLETEGDRELGKSGFGRLGDLEPEAERV